MEAIGAVASITAIVDISQKIIEWTAEYTKRVAHASSEIRALSNGLSTLNRVLLDLQGRNSGHIFSSLTDTLDQCYQNIAKVAQTLNIGKGVRKAVQSLLWPFRQKEIQEFLEKLSRYLQLFTIALAGDQRSLTVDIRGLIVDGMLGRQNPFSELSLTKMTIGQSPTTSEMWLSEWSLSYLERVPIRLTYNTFSTSAKRVSHAAFFQPLLTTCRRNIAVAPESQLQFEPQHSFSKSWSGDWQVVHTRL
jgi:uncharacterized protein YukE